MLLNDNLEDYKRVYWFDASFNPSNGTKMTAQQVTSDPFIIVGLSNPTDTQTLLYQHIILHEASVERIKAIRTRDGNRRIPDDSQRPSSLLAALTSSQMVKRTRTSSGPNGTIRKSVVVIDTKAVKCVMNKNQQM